LKWDHPTDIQIEAIPHGIKGRDIIGLAKTGSGKTGAFAIPVLQALLENPQPFFACAMAPTRFFIIILLLLLCCWPFLLLTSPQQL